MSIAKIRIAKPSREIDRGLTPAERFFVQYAYPPKLILDGIGLMWALHFVWERLWTQSLISLIGFSLVGSVFAGAANRSVLAATLLGCFCRCLAKGTNVAAQISGAIVLVFGVWSRTPFYGFIGISFILLAHANAWRQAYRIQNLGVMKHDS